MDIQTINIYLTENCNLNCKYCYVKFKNKSLKFETAKNAVDFLILNSGEKKLLNIGFFGGEPSLEFEMIKKIVNYSKKQEEKTNKRFIYSITTNGTLLTKEIVDYFFKNHITVMFSWDGTKEHIVKYKGEKAYYQMLNSVKLLKQRGALAHARITVDPKDIELVERVDHAREVGFDIFSLVYMNRVQEWNQKKADQEYKRYAKYFIRNCEKGKVINDRHLLSNLSYIAGIEKPGKYPCGVGKGMFGITVDGDILPCHHPECWQDQNLGNVFDKKINQKRKQFLDYKRKDFKGCDDCIAKEVCPGSCLALNYLENKDMFKPTKDNCVWTRARYKAAKHIYNELLIKKANLDLIRALICKQIYWIRASNDIVLNINELDNEIIGTDLDLVFKLEEKDLKPETSDKILEFLQKLLKQKKKFRIVLPIPPCVFNNYDKYNVKKNLLYQKPRSKKFWDYFKVYKKSIKLPKTCKYCKHRIKKSCDYCYFGFNLPDNGV